MKAFDANASGGLQRDVFGVSRSCAGRERGRERLDRDGVELGP
jgi:hypothetical protein